MRILKVLIVLFLFSHPLLSQEVTTETLFKLAEKNCGQNYQLANIYLDSIITISKERKDTFSKFTAHLKKGDCAKYNNDIENTFVHYEQATDVLNSMNSSVSKDSFTCILNYSLGSYFYKIGDNNSALKYFEKNIDLISRRNILYKTDTLFLIRNYQFLSSVFENSGDIDACLNIYNYILQIRTAQNNDPDHPQVKQMRCNLASFQVRHSIFFKEANANFEICIPALQIIYEESTDYKKHYGSYLNFSHSNYAKSHLNLNNPDSALILINKSLTYPTTGEDYIARSELVLGKIYAQLNQHQKANKYFNSALQKMSAFYNTKHHEIGELHLAIGEYHIEQNEIEKALQHFQSAFSQLVTGFNEKDFLTNPDFSDLYINDHLVQTLHQKTIALNKLSIQKNDAAIKQKAFETGKLCVELMKKAMAENTSGENDVIGIVTRNYSLFEELLLVGYELGENTSLFDIIESSKSASLLKSVQFKNDLKHGAIPPKLSNEYHLLKLAISKKEKEIFALTSQNEVDQVALATLGNELFDLKNQLAEVKAKIDKYLPQQNKAKFNITITETQSNLLADGEAIIEYFIGKNNSFAYLIKKDTVYFEKLYSTSDDLLAAANLKELIYNNTNENNEIYRQDAQRLYQVLIAPFEKYDLPNKLIIIPDGPLYYLPFEVLLDGPVEDLREFADYPYLIQKKTISYCFSSTMLDRLEGKILDSETLSEVLAFAPSFKSISANSRSVSEERGDLNDLKYNKEELEQIENWVTCRLLLDTTATKQKFMAMAGKYRYIHLATHAKVDDQNPDFSYLAFTNDIDTIYTTIADFKMSCNDLSMLTLNADMVVLSACETGVGKVYKGEGIISISRGFIEAGAKSIVPTLWSIDDQLTSDLMNKFYEHLAEENVSKDEALCRAKKDYLNEHDAFDAHPKYWAAFVPYGDMTGQRLSAPTGWFERSWVLLLFLFLGYYGRRFFMIGDDAVPLFPPCPCGGVWVWN